MSFFDRYNRFRSQFDLMAAAFVLPSLKVAPRDLRGKTAVVTGANTGIGLEISRKLASMGATVILACRDPVKGEAARRDIVGSTGNESVEVREVDLMEWRSVREFVEGLRGEGREVDLLVNNAGITASRLRFAEDGYEHTYATNFLSPLLLTLLLLPSLRPLARITNISALSHYDATLSSLDITDLDGSKALEVGEGDLLPDLGFPLYNRSKLSQVMFGRALQEKLEKSEKYGKMGVTVHSVHPGFVKSSIWERNLGDNKFYDRAMKGIVGVVNTFGVSTEQGACSPVFVAVDPGAGKEGGGYWDSRQTRRSPHSLVEDKQLRDQLWDTWLDALGLGAEELL